MYLPKHFSTQESRALSLIDAEPFATVVSLDEAGSPFINHLPLLLENGEKHQSLLGHMSKRNPQWLHFANGSKAVAVFHGPHTYITPTWYKSGRDVPTWNYAVVHVQGHVKLIEDFGGLVSILKKVTERFEKNNAHPWEFDLPEDLTDPASLTSAIIGFEIKIEKIEAKFKLSQNRSCEDKRGVIDGLADRTDEKSRQVQAMMQELAHE